MEEVTVITGSPLRLSPSQRAVELLRPYPLLTLYLLTATAGWWLLAVPLAAATCLAGFVQMHDAIHHSLGLSRKGHDLFMSASGLLLLKSGHGLQVTHLRHNGRCLKHDDPEGVCTTWPFYRVLLEGPIHPSPCAFTPSVRSAGRWAQNLDAGALVFRLPPALRVPQGADGAAACDGKKGGDAPYQAHVYEEDEGR